MQGNAKKRRKPRTNRQTEEEDGKNQWSKLNPLCVVLVVYCAWLLRCVLCMCIQVTPYFRIFLKQGESKRGSQIDIEIGQTGRLADKAGRQVSTRSWYTSLLFTSLCVCVCVCHSGSTGQQHWTVECRTGEERRGRREYYIYLESN